MLPGLVSCDASRLQKVVRWDLDDASAVTVCRDGPGRDRAGDWCVWAGEWMCRVDGKVMMVSKQVVGLW